MLKSTLQLQVATRGICAMLNLDFNRVQLHIQPTSFSYYRGKAVPKFEWFNDKDYGITGCHVIINPILSEDEWLKILCHELIHVHQYESHALKFEFDKSAELAAHFDGHIGLLLPQCQPQVLWHGQDYTHLLRLQALIGSMSLYRSLPWEQEAFANEADVHNAIPYWLLDEIEQAGNA